MDKKSKSLTIASILFLVASCVVYVLMLIISSLLSVIVESADSEATIRYIFYALFGSGMLLAIIALVFCVIALIKDKKSDGDFNSVFKFALVGAIFNLLTSIFNVVYSSINLTEIMGVVALIFSAIQMIIAIALLFKYIKLKKNCSVKIETASTEAPNL